MLLNVRVKCLANCLVSGSKEYAQRWWFNKKIMVFSLHTVAYLYSRQLQCYKYKAFHSIGFGVRTITHGNTCKVLTFSLQILINSPHDTDAACTHKKEGKIQIQRVLFFSYTSMLCNLQDHCSLLVHVRLSALFLPFGRPPWLCLVIHVGCSSILCE